MEEAKVKKFSSMSKSAWIKIIIVVALVIIAGFVAWSYNKHNTPDAKKQAEYNLIIRNVSKHQLIPQEQAIIATINEADKMIAEQPFYANVHNGDKLIIFPIAQRAVIYSPTLDLIINSGPFVLSDKK